MTSAGEVPIGPPEYGALSAGAAGQLLLTTNVGTRVNVRLTGQLPEFPALEKSADAVIAAFHQFVDTPDGRPRPLMIRLQVDPGADCTQLAALAKKLDAARKKKARSALLVPISCRLSSPSKRRSPPTPSLNKSRPLSLQLPISNFWRLRLTAPNSLTPAVGGALRDCSMS